MILDLLFPKKCVGCRRVGNYFCDECIQNIAQTDLVCPQCERPSVGGLTHPLCKRKFGLDGLWSLGMYQDPLKLAIQKLKYKWVKELAEILVNITIDYWARYQPLLLEKIKKHRGENWLIIPVPLHKKRENFRGFNQAALLGQLLSKKIGLGYLDGLNRIRQTKPQVGLLGKERRENIRGAFALSNLKLPASNILLIDDVWTTGSTLKECCYVLKKGGAKEVWGLTLAR